MAKEYLGNLELMVLLSLIRVGDNAYGVPISHEIEQRTGRDDGRLSGFHAISP